MNTEQLKNVERILRLFLISLLVMTAVYKFLVGGDQFVNFYASKFANNPYGLGMTLIDPFMRCIATIEIVLALGLLFERTRNIALYSYFGFLTILMFGHFALSEFHEVNGLFDYMFAGLLIYVLPRHPHLFWRA